MSETREGEDATERLADRSAGRTPKVGPRRKQFTLGSMMILVAILAVAFTFPQLSVGLLIGGVVPFLLFVVLSAFDALLAGVCGSIGVGYERWLDAPARANPPNEREP